jgi:uncharacterized protein YcbK (DUF882 family)
VLVRIAREFPVVLSLARVALRVSATATILLAGGNSLQTAVAEGDTRTISFHHVHTGEDITVTFKREGRYDEAALKKLDWFMRDWRREEDTHMDPHLFDLLWETFREVGGKEPIQVICGYRSPETNSMLRARSNGVAEFSQHIQGHAMDFYIPGVPLSEIRAVGLRLQRGGVGFYPTSGSPFIHMDTGTIRHWPRMTREELVKVFPDERTVHIPSDGHPLAGYALALADVERRGNMPSGTSLASARDAGVIGGNEQAQAIDGQSKRGLLAKLFGIGRDQDEESEQQDARSVSKQARTPVAVASVSPPTRVSTERIVPLPLPVARPKPVDVATVLPRPRPTAKPVVTASANNVFDNRGYWRGAVEAGPALTPAGATASFEVASADSMTTGSAALAYATESETPPSARARPMGSNMPRLPSAATVMPASPNTTVMVKPPLAAATSPITGTVADPWLRAAILTPSMSDFMTTTRMGSVDMRAYGGLIHKPSTLLVITFSADPHLGMVADRFSGHAVVFLATATFVTKIASLQ